MATAALFDLVRLLYQSVRTAQLTTVVQLMGGSS